MSKMTTDEKRYGAWNDVQKRFVFGINESSPKKAMRKLFEKIGDDARKWRYDIREIPKNWKNPKNPYHNNTR